MTLKECLLCLPALEALARAKTVGKRKKILKQTSNKIYSVLSELVRQVLKGNIVIPARVKENLKPYKKTLRKIATAKTRNLQRELINQTGAGLLSSLLIPVVTILGRVAANKILE